MEDTKRAVAVHHTDTEQAAWDAGAQEKRVRAGEAASYYRKIYAWQDAEGDPALKGSWKFIHHVVSAEGEPGAASTKACSAGIGILNGGRGGTTIPDEDRRGVWSHLAAHLRDAGLEPPDLKGEDVKTVKLKDFVLDDKGHFTALVAPFLSVDKQGDVTMPGAFGAGQPILISGFGHASWGDGTAALTVGKGKIYDGPDGGVVEGQFNLNTFAGRETYETVKFNGELQEWSYALPKIVAEYLTLTELSAQGHHVQANGYGTEEKLRVLRKITVNEASPVLMGAGNGTRTLAIKSAEAAPEEEPRPSFGERMLKAQIENDDIALVLRNRRGFRSSERKPSVSDLEGAKAWLGSLERLSGAIRDLVGQNNTLDAAIARFEKIKGGKK